MSQNLRTTTAMRLDSLLLSTAQAACTVGLELQHSEKRSWRRSTTRLMPRHASASGTATLPLV